MMTSRWTDDRMDDLKHQVEQVDRRVNDGFVQLRNEFREHRREMDARFDRMEARLDTAFGKIDDQFEKVEGGFNRTQEMVIGLHATLTRFSLGFAGAVMVAIIAALLAS